MYNKNFHKMMKINLQILFIKSKAISKDTLTITFNSLYEIYRVTKKKSNLINVKNYVDYFQTYHRLGTVVRNIYNTLYLSNLLEEEGDYSEAVELLRITLKTISSLRELRILKKPNYIKNPLTLL